MIILLIVIQGCTLVTTPTKTATNPATFPPETSSPLPTLTVTITPTSSAFSGCPLETWSYYENSNIGYSLCYPGDWQYSKDFETPAGSKLPDPQNLRSRLRLVSLDENTIEVLVDVWDASALQGIDLFTWIGKNSAGILFEQDYQPVIYNATVLGLSALFHLHSGISGPSAGDPVLIFTDGKQIYRFSMNYPMSQQAELFTHILESFKLAGQPSGHLFIPEDYARTGMLPFDLTPTPGSNVAMPDRLLARLGRFWSTRMVVSADGHLVGIADGNELCQYRLPGMQLNWCTLVDRSAMGYLWALARHPFDQVYAMGLANGKIILVDAVTGKVSKVIQAANTNIRALAWSPDGSLLAFSSDESGVVLLDTKAGNQLNERILANRYLTILSWSSDGKNLAAGTFDGRVYLWDYSTGGQVAQWQAPLLYNIDSLVWSANNHSIFVGTSSVSCYENCSPAYDGFVARLDADDLTLVEKWEAGDAAQALVISPDGNRVAAALRSGTLSFLDSELAPIKSKNIGVYGESGLAWPSSNELILLSRYGLESEDPALGDFPAMVGPDRLVLVDPKSDQHEQFALTGYGAVAAPAWSPDGKQLAAGTPTGDILSWDSQTLEGHTLISGSGYFSPYAWSLDGKYLARVSSDGSLSILDAESYELVMELTGAANRPRRLLWSCDSSYLAAADWEIVTVWEVKSGQLIFSTPTLSSDSIIWSPDRPMLAVATGEDGTQLDFWDVTTAQAVRQMTLSGWISDLDWADNSSDGRIAIQSGGWAEVWDVSTNTLLFRTSDTGHFWGIERVALSPDGQTLATATMEIDLWDIATGSKLEHLEGHSDTVNSLVFSPDGAKLVSSDSGGVILVWDIKNDNRHQ